jgi:predicted nucleotidyltransferase
MTIAAGVELPEAGIVEICRRHQVRELSLFGSAARGEMRPDSDVDLLVDFLPGARPGLLGVSAMMRELSALLGRRVDLAVKPALKPLVRAGVLAEARLIYAA